MRSTKKSQPVTFRIDDECLIALKHESMDRKVSLNSLVHGLIDRYVDYYRHLEKFETVVMPKSTFKGVLSLLNDEQISALANDLKGEVNEFIHFRWGKKDQASALEFLRMFFTECGYGEYREEFHNNNYSLVIHHKLGKKGSLYLRSFLESLFHDIKFQDITFVSSDEGLSVKLTLETITN